MKRVTCDVTTCSYNQSYTCYARHILITEQGTDRSEYTCCGAFLNKQYYSNVVEETYFAEPVEYIKCKVGGCRYYEEDKCTLSHIHIDSKKTAQVYMETYCNSFLER